MCVEILTHQVLGPIAFTCRRSAERSRDVPQSMHRLLLGLLLCQGPDDEVVNMEMTSCC